MQRIRELAVQAANATNNAADRASLDKEVQTLLDEIGRISFQTEFNNSAILDGTLNPLFFQVGANQGQTIALEGADARPAKLGTSEKVAGDPNSIPQGLSQAELKQLAEQGATVMDIIISVAGLTNDFYVNLSGKDIRSLDEMVREINAAISEKASAEPIAEARIVQEAQLKASLRVLDDGSTTIVINGAFATTAAPNPPDPAAVFSVGGGDLGSPAFAAGTKTMFPDPVPDNNAKQVNLTQLNVTTRESAYKTIGAIDGALDQIRGFRANLGAAQSRLESTITNLQVSSENISAARSRIRDTDFAAETAELTRVQILQQAGTSVLAQANAAPQSVLSLLQ